MIELIFKLEGSADFQKMAFLLMGSLGCLVDIELDKMIISSISEDEAAIKAAMAEYELLSEEIED